MGWMNLEPIMQNDVSLKEKYEHHTLMHIYGIKRNGSEEFIYSRAAVDKQTERIDLWTRGEGRRG